MLLWRGAIETGQAAGEGVLGLARATRPQRLCTTHVVLHPPQPRRVMLPYVRVDIAPAHPKLRLELRYER